MKIWEVLQTKNLGKEYKVKIFGSDIILKVDYDEGTTTYLNLKTTSNNFMLANNFILEGMYLGAILEKDFEEI